MNDDFTRTEWAIRYLDDELSPEERQRFEREIGSDPDLQEELANLRATRSAIKIYGLRNRISRLRDEMKNEVPAVPRKVGIVRRLGSYTYRVAASIILVLVAFGVVQYLSLSAPRMYDQLFRPYEVTALRGENTSPGLEQRYKEHDHAEVVRLYGQLAAPGIKEMFLAGQSYMVLGRYPNAIAQFRQVILRNREAGTGGFEDDAEYFLALSLLHDGQVDEAATLFRKIRADKEHLYHDRVDGWFMMRLRLLEWKS